ncbi:hypothetical protein GF342_00065 [Candidatus Woesearchaeota archaeon]|nr:hypothetical protein [Candidatus Woesearchaeota archaeon]
MKILSPEEQAALKDLSEHFEKYIDEYREQKKKELAKGKRAALLEELRRLEHTQEGYTHGMISDVEIHIRFNNAKIQVLKDILGPQTYTYDTTPVTLTTGQLQALLKECFFLYGPQNSLDDIDAFKKKIATTILIDPDHTEGTLHGTLRIWVHFPDNASFQHINGKEYHIKAEQGTCSIEGRPPLSPQEQKRVFALLAEDLKQY